MPDVGIRIGPTALTTSAATLYTVPASTTLTVRGIHIANESAVAAVTVTMSIGTDGAGKRFLGPGLSLPASSSYDWSGFLIVNAAEVIQALASATTSLTVTISGINTT